MPRQHEKPTWRGMDLDDTAYKVYEPKKPLWKLMDRTETSSQVNGHLVHLTLKLKYNVVRFFLPLQTIEIVRGNHNLYFQKDTAWDAEKRKQRCDVMLVAWYTCGSNWPI